MMHVIINEGLVDRDYVERYTVGFEDLTQRVEDYPPEWASQVTGIPAVDIVTLAREYATAQPSAIRIGVAIERNAAAARRCAPSPVFPPWSGHGVMWGAGSSASTVDLPLKWDALSRPDLSAPAPGC